MFPLQNKIFYYFAKLAAQRDFASLIIGPYSNVLISNFEPFYKFEKIHVASGLFGRYRLIYFWPRATKIFKLHLGLILIINGKLESKYAINIFLGFRIFMGGSG